MTTVMRSVTRSLGVVGVMAVLLSGCTTSLSKAKRAATMSQQIYSAVSSETVSQIGMIVKKDQTGGVTEEDRTKLSLLNQLRKALDQYAEAHNAYVSSLKVWETTGKKPEDLEQLSTHMITLIQEAQELAKRLNIKIPSIGGN